MNIDEIAKLCSEPGAREWSGIVNAWRQKRPINKQEVIEALRSGVPVPSYAAEFLADVLETKYKFKRGNKPWYPQDNPLHRPAFVVSWIRDFEGWITNPASLPEDVHEDFRRQIEEYHNLVVYRSAKVTLNAAAVELTAEVVQLSVPMVRKKVTKFNQEVQAVAKLTGCTEAEARNYLLL